MANTLGRRVAAVREFNRFYTSRIGVLDEGYLSSRFSLTEVRVLYELAHHGSITATELGRNLRLDAGYVSRMVRGFARRGLLARTGAKDDGRKSILRLTARGKATVAPLEAKARDQIAAMLKDVPSADQDRLVEPPERRRQPEIAQQIHPSARRQGRERVKPEHRLLDSGIDEVLQPPGAMLRRAGDAKGFHRIVGDEPGRAFDVAPCDRGDHGFDYPQPPQCGVAADQEPELPE